MDCDFVNSMFCEILILVIFFFTLFYFIYLSIFFHFYDDEKGIVFLNLFATHLNYSFI